MILAEREARLAAETAGAAAKLALGIEIERLKLEIARLRRERFGPSSERSGRIEQLELRLESLEEAASAATAKSEETVTVAGFARQKPARHPLPDHLPRHRVVHPGPEACSCCGGAALRKLGEEITETLERIPASWRVIQHVRERFSCRACETIAEAPAPFHPISRGRAGPELLAEVVFGKFGLHLPLHRQSERFPSAVHPTMLPHGVAPGQLRPGRRADRGLDPGRLGWCGHDGVDAPGRPDRGTCPKGWSHSPG